MRCAIGSEEAHVVVQFEDCSVSLLLKSNVLAEDIEVGQYYTVKECKGEVLFVGKVWTRVAIQLKCGSTMVPSPNNGGSSVVDIIPLAVASYKNQSRVPRLVRLNVVPHR